MLPNEPCHRGKQAEVIRWILGVRGRQNPPQAYPDEDHQDRRNVIDQGPAAQVRQDPGDGARQQHTR